MPEFEVTVTMKLELSGTLIIKAKDEDAATEKVQKMIDDGTICLTNWEMKEIKGQDTEWESTSEEVDIDYVNEL